MSDTASQRTANVIGTGLIGGSIAAGLRARGWCVHGVDAEPAISERALAANIIDAVGVAPEAEITFVAVPVLSGALDGSPHCIEPRLGGVGQDRFNHEPRVA